MALLEGKGVSKSFGALNAVDQVDFQIGQNEILSH
jgi:ABC-type branched-subunit amino acid transport system ATPase component